MAAGGGSDWRGFLGDQPLGGAPFIVLTATCAYLGYVALTVLPRHRAEGDLSQWLAERTASVLESRTSRRSFIVRTALGGLGAHRGAAALPAASRHRVRRHLRLRGFVV